MMPRCSGEAQCAHTTEQQATEMCAAPQLRMQGSLCIAKGVPGSMWGIACAKVGAQRFGTFQTRLCEVRGTLTTALNAGAPTPEAPAATSVTCEQPRSQALFGPCLLTHELLGRVPGSRSVICDVGGLSLRASRCRSMHSGSCQESTRPGCVDQPGQIDAVHLRAAMTIVVSSGLWAQPDWADTCNIQNRKHATSVTLQGDAVRPSRPMQHAKHPGGRGLWPQQAQCTIRLHQAGY